MRSEGVLTEHAQAVVDGDDDDVAVAGEDAAVEQVGGALHVGAAVDEHHDGLGAPALSDVWGGKGERGGRAREGRRERGGEGD